MELPDNIRGDAQRHLHRVQRTLVQAEEGAVEATAAVAHRGGRRRRRRRGGAAPGGPPGQASPWKHHGGVSDILSVNVEMSLLTFYH